MVSPETFGELYSAERGTMGKKDITLKSYLSDARRYADLLNGSIFQGKQAIHAEELQEAPTVQSKSDRHVIVERTNDIAMKQTRDGSLFVVWLVENQSHIDYSMPIRVMMQDSLAYDKQLKELQKKNQALAQSVPAIFADSGEFLSKATAQDRLHPVITLIVYWGEEHWTGAQSLHDMIDFGTDNSLAKELKMLVPEYPLHFFNLSEIHDYKNFQTELRLLFELYDRRNNKKEFQKYLHNYESYHQMDSETYQTLSVLTGMKELLSSAIPEKEADTTMWKAIEDLISDGKTEGKLEGRLDALYELVQDGLLSIKDAAVKASMTEDTFSSEMKKAGY